MTYASASDVSARLGRELTPEETTLVNTRLADAERMLSRRVDLAAGISAGTFTQADVVQVEADMVLRIVRNPEGHVSETDGSYSYMLSYSVASGKLEVLPEEWETLGVRTGGPMVLYPSFGGSA
ncbi:hypothetical protein BST36_17330 [Mycolicibacterium moriokaense]|uniref:Head-to-tail adaptor n=1 Tax=Mycolicibacterium moriokaense TaxID=39691 RepID=A0AAD1M7V2_9MYCO|nr:Gp19/Gp15/Gp42 family protein [Mycolicibacterium moriokaense]MCV7037349.1 hypothetical protein [Mycolicibacterium moriokaense]ORB21251.1 hypothetical protein BST36_17330 [Mycolicibacterium moriokaense]BBX04307.1 hypothetical protein MMOR_52430 [Mycolicibacterium moriokaense]